MPYKDPDQQKRYFEEYRKKNRSLLVEKERKRYVKKSESIRERTREWRLNRLYGLTVEQRDALFEAQGFTCAICGDHMPKGKNKWHVDHDHKTGAVRGVLCRYCNVGLGSFYENPRLLRNAAEYIERFGQKPSAE